MRTNDHGLGEEQFDRISCTMAYAVSYAKTRFGFTVIKHILEGRCLHRDIKEEVEGSADECVF